MANIQKYLIDFDSKIRLGWNTESKTLRQKRDIILDKLRAGFEEMRDEGKDVPSFSYFNQGSYEMDTGIWPADGDYDIDVGLCFNASRDRYENPVDLKVLVAEVLEGHTVLGTQIKKSCVTVKYQLDGEQAYHVDLAVYTQDNPDSAQKQLFLAKGERGSGEDHRWWEESNPQGLTKWVEDQFKDEQRAQFLRVIRALKRWKTEKFKKDGNNAPSGIGLTVAAGMWFQPQGRVDAFANRTDVDDLAAMTGLVKRMVDAFVPSVQADGSPCYRLTVRVPVAPGLDIFERMTDGQMTTLRERLVQLEECLERVKNEASPSRACQLMRQHFGEEFPVPDKDSTGTPGGRTIISSAVSA